MEYTLNGDKLVIEATTARQVYTLYDVMNLLPADPGDISINQYGSQLVDGQATITLPDYKRVEVTLSPYWADPYRAFMDRYFGYQHHLPEVVIPAKNYGLGLTRVIESVEILPRSRFHALMYVPLRSDQNRIDDLVKRFVGSELCNPEFTRNNNGQYSMNPDYGRSGPSYEPSASNAAVKRALFRWWYATIASDAQKQVIKDHWSLTDGFNAFDFEYEYSRDITLPDSRSMSFEEFRSL